MNKLKSLVLLLVAMIALPTIAQQVPNLPIDPAVRYGKLENGLTYYIRHNALPEKQVNFYIAQKVGAVQEEDNQRGLAHFLEHMCFNGTKNFPGDRLIKYCETIGVKFGQNLNAYTSTDETVYNINDVPVTESNIDSCLLILHDWACDLTLAEPEIDKERGVIHEEWRMRSSAMMRMLERQLPNIFPGSRYGNRLPIGTMEVIDNFKPQELRDYYHKWYRPDLQGIIIVGDIDVDKIEAKVKEVFSPIKMPENPAKYEHYPVPTTPEAIYIVEKDKEQSRGLILLMFKHDVLPENMRGTAAFQSMQLITSVATDAFNARLNEMSQKPDCPFIGAGAGDGTILGIAKTMGAYSIQILPKPGQDAAAIEAVMTEVERVQQHGLTGTELFRSKEEFMSKLEKIYNNRDKQKSNFYTPQYVRHFLEGNAIPDIETEYNLYKMLSQQVPDQVYTGLFKEYTASVDTNFICLAMYPEKEGVTIPTAESLKQAVAKAKAAKTEAYVDNVKNEPLVPELPEKGKIVKEEAADFGYTKWTLSNGANVYFKKTDFNDSEILFRATSFGGNSRVADKDLINLNLLGQVMGSTGLGNFTSTELQKKLAGKQAGVSISVGELTEGLTGSSTPKDLRTLFELIYLRFQQPANDVEAYNNTLTYLKTNLENAEKQPQVALSDSLTGTYYNHHPRRQRIRLADLEKANYEEIKRIYSERFNAGGDFDFYFTGAFNQDSLRLFVEQYIAPLKSVEKRETFVNLKVYPVTGIVDNHFTRKMETPQATIVQMWNGTMPYNMKNAAIVNTFGEILTQRYLKSIREDAGLTYSVGAGASLDYGTRDAYTLQIYCPMKPAAKDSVLLLMEQGIMEMAKNGVTAEELDKVKKFEAKEYESNQKKNGYWTSLIIDKTRWNKDEHTDYVKTVESVTSKDIQNFINKVLLKQKNRVTISMLPEDMTE